MQIALSRPLAHRRPGLILLTWGSVVAAWAVTILLVALGQGDLLMDHDAVLGNRTLAWPLALLLFLTTWQLMTATMMLPSTLPMTQIFLRISRNQNRPRLAFGFFLLGYFAVWTGFALMALAADAGLHGMVDRWSWLAERPWLIGGSVLVLAGAFQFSPLKERCLDACRDPLAFLWRHYARGPGPAWRLGIRHGLFCLGCCWALMLTMFAVGMGNLAWMAGLTGVMVIEKVTRQGRRLVPILGSGLIAWGVLVMLNLDWLPAFIRGV